MVFIINSDDFEVPIPHLSPPLNRKIKLSGFPTFYSESGEYLQPVNLWLNFLVNVRRAKNINSNVRAIKRYWNFLESNDLSWDHFPKQKSLKPTYRFKNDDLLLSARNGALQLSTAATYISHIVGFYKWAGHEGLIQFSEDSKPFEMELAQISNSGPLRFINRNLFVSSTDLRIRNPRKNFEQQLCPFTKDEIRTFFQIIRSFTDEFLLHQLLQFQCGLRMEEACFYPLDLVFNPSASETRFDVEIGPHIGIPTKYGKIRTIEVPASLMKKMYLYSISSRRATRQKKQPDTKTLLLNQHGLPMTPINVTQHYVKARKEYKEVTGRSLNHRPHDARATYGTYRLASLLEHLQPLDAMTLVMGWMGHRHESTTWRYLRYLNKEKLNSNAISMMDIFLEEALGGHDE